MDRTEDTAILRKLAEDLTRCFDANPERDFMAIGITRDEARALSALVAEAKLSKPEREAARWRVKDIRTGRYSLGPGPSGTTKNRKHAYVFTDRAEARRDARLWNACGVVTARIIRVVRPARGD